MKSFGSRSQISLIVAFASSGALAQSAIGQGANPLGPPPRGQSPNPNQLGTMPPIRSGPAAGRRLRALGRTLDNREHLGRAAVRQYRRQPRGQDDCAGPHLGSDANTHGTQRALGALRRKSAIRPTARAYPANAQEFCRTYNAHADDHTPSAQPQILSACLVPHAAGSRLARAISFPALLRWGAEA